MEGDGLRNGQGLLMNVIDLREMTRDVGPMPMKSSRKVL